MKSYYIIAVVAVIGFIALGASSLKNSMTPYVKTFAEARASTADRIQVPGDIIKGMTNYNSRHAALVFHMKDPKGDQMKFVYQGVRPGNFDQAPRVVAIGKYREGAFHAEQLLVKCPSKYESK